MSAVSDSPVDLRAQVRRWGALAGAGKEDRDWKLFVESRLSTPPPVSPIDFLQEYYVACGVVSAFDLDARHRVDASVAPIQ